MKAKVTVLVLGLSTSFVMNMMPSPSSAGFYEDLQKAIGNSGAIEKTIQDAIRKPDQKTPQPKPQRQTPPPFDPPPAASQTTVQQPSSQASRQIAADVQALLNSLGYDAGPVDGAPGAKTRTAIRQFQGDAGVFVNGRISPILVKQLKKAGGTVAATQSAPGAPTAPPPSRVGARQPLQGTATPLAVRAKSSGNVILPSSGKIFGPDIVGLRIGMSPKEVHAIIKKRNPDFKFRVNKVTLFQDLNVPYKDEESILDFRAYARAGGQSETFDVTFSRGRAGQERAMKIYRSLSFKEQNGPTHRVLLNALGEKYGTPTKSKNRDKAIFDYHWIYDLNARLKQNGRAVRSNQLDLCYISFRRIANILNSPKRAIKIRKSIHPDCGSVSLTVSARIDESNPLSINAGLLKSYWVRVLAYDEMASAAFSLATHRSQIKRQMAQQKVDQARQKKPDL